MTTNQLSKAIQSGEQALYIRRNLYGNDDSHPETVASITQLSIFYKMTGNHEKADEYHKISN